eukprot:IDg4098t1
MSSLKNREALHFTREFQGSEQSNGQLFWCVTEDISLHSIALGVMMDMFKLTSHHHVLCSSASSLRTAYILALAFRGLILQELGVGLTEVQKRALGPVVGRGLNLCENMATVAIGGAPRKLLGSVSSVNNAESLQTLERERRAKFEITMSKYQAARAQEMREPRQILSDDDEQSINHDQGGSTLGSPFLEENHTTAVDLFRMFE